MKRALIALAALLGLASSQSIGQSVKYYPQLPAAGALSGSNIWALSKGANTLYQSDLTTLSAFVLNSGGLVGDCTIASLTITCTKTNGTALGTFATQSYATPPIIGATTPNFGYFSQITMSGLLDTQASSTSGAGLRIPPGSAPTTPVNGDVWTTASGLYVRVNGSTVGPLGTGGGSGCSTVGASVLIGDGAGGCGNVTIGAGLTLAGTTLSANFAAPPSIGSTTPGSGAFSTLSASGAVSGTGFSTYLASPPAIGGAAAAAGSFTNLSSSGTVSGTGFSNYLLAPPAIGSTTPAPGKFTTLQATGLVSTAASGTGGAGFNLPQGVAPTTPNNGDVWTTTAGMYAQINGSTVGPFGTGGTPANPTATASDIAVDGSATTFMRSDAAPAVQKGTSSQFGVVKCDGVTIVCSSSVMASGGTVVAGTTQTVTANQWLAGTAFTVTTAGQTLTLPASSTLSANGGIAIQTIGQSVTLAPNAADAINGGTAGASVTIASGITAFVTTDGAGNVRASPTTNSGSGTVTTSGSPSSGNLAKFSGSTVVTSGDLSGDCTTSGTLAVICTKTGGTSFAASATTDTTNATNITTGTLANGRVGAIPLSTGTSVTLTAPRQYYVCTSTCTVTPPVPAAGYEFCVMNANNTSTVITLAALGSSAQYENTARTAYGTAGTGTFVSGGAAGDKVCLVGLDATHYLTISYNGTWSAN